MSQPTQTTRSDDEARGAFSNWVDSAIKNPKKVYRAMFFVVVIFFLLTTLFPLY